MCSLRFCNVFAQERNGDLQVDLDATRGLAQEMRRALEGSVQEAANLTNKVGESDGAAAAAQAALADRAREAAGLQAKLQQAELAAANAQLLHEHSKHEILELQHAVELAEGALTKAQAALQAAAQEILDLHRRGDTAEAAHRDAQGILEVAQRELAHSRQEVASLEDSLQLAHQEAAQKVAGLLQDLTVARSAATAGDAALAALQQQVLLLDRCLAEVGTDRDAWKTTAKDRSGRRHSPAAGSGTAAEGAGGG